MRRPSSFASTSATPSRAASGGQVEQRRRLHADAVAHDDGRSVELGRGQRGVHGG
ncbi:MAG: hypothetical protein QM771_11200 [Nitrospira sp.]